MEIKMVVVQRGKENSKDSGINKNWWQKKDWGQKFFNVSTITGGDDIRGVFWISN